MPTTTNIKKSVRYIVCRRPSYGDYPWVTYAWVTDPDDASSEVHWLERHGWEVVCLWLELSHEPTLDIDDWLSEEAHGRILSQIKEFKDLTPWGA